MALMGFALGGVPRYAAGMTVAFIGASVACFVLSVCWFAGIFENRTRRWFDVAPTLTEEDVREIEHSATSILPKARRERQQLARSHED
jgi:hypothetical protein